MLVHSIQLDFRIAYITPVQVVLASVAIGDYVSVKDGTTIVVSIIVIPVVMISYWSFIVIDAWYLKWTKRSSLSLIRVGFKNKF